MDTWTYQSRWWIVTGYALVFVGTVVELAGQFSVIVNDNLSGTVVVDFLVSPFVALGSLWAWWWLAQIVIATDEQRRIVRNGIAGLAFALVCEATLYFTSFADVASVNSIANWVFASWTLSAAGDLAAAIGFVTAFMGLRRDQSADLEESASPEDWDT